MSKLVRAAFAAALLLPVSACVVVGMTNYAVPIGAPSATLTFEMAPAEATTVSQQIVFVNDEISMEMPAIYAIHNGVIQGERAGNQLPNRANVVEAGRKQFILATTIFPGYPSHEYCRSQVSFTPVADHAYAMRHITDGNRCALLILDRRTGAEPPDLLTHDAYRVGSIPIQ